VLCGEKQRARARNWVPRPCAVPSQNPDEIAVKIRTGSDHRAGAGDVGCAGNCPGVQLPCQHLFVPFRGMAMAANSDSFSIAKYVVQGTVKDDQGLPLKARRCTSAKNWFTPTVPDVSWCASRSAARSVERCAGRVHQQRRYQVVSAPSQVSAEPEDSATDVQVVVKRVPPPQAKLYRQ